MEASNVLGNLEQEYVVVNTRYNTWTQIQVNYIMAETFQGCQELVHSWGNVNIRYNQAGMGMVL